MSLFYTVLVGIFFGIIYYVNMVKSIKDPYKNCSFSSNILTDILAFIVGLIIIYYGYIKYKNKVLILLGVAIITEHILQFTYKI